MSVLVLVVDDEPDVEALFRQQFRRDLRAQRFVMDFAISAADALSRIADPIEQTLILIPGVGCAPSHFCLARNADG